jgi:DNA-directed RNA polymerase specialized sigma24 family protein
MTYDPWARPGFDDLYRSQRGPLYQLAFLLVRSRPVAEELAQETFARLYQHFGEIGDPVGFLRTTLVRICVNRRGQGLFDAQGLPVGEPGPTGHADLDAMWAAFGTLHRERRVALVLRDYANLTGRDIAELVGGTEATARSRIQRGLVDLRRASGATGTTEEVERQLHETLVAKAAQIGDTPRMNGRWLEASELAAEVPRHDATRPRRTRRAWAVVAVAAAFLLVVMAVAVLTTSGDSSSSSSVKAGAVGLSDPAAVQRALDGVPSSVYGSVGADPSAHRVVQTGYPALSLYGKPEVLFIGEEWCPFCAGERWPLALALSRFGTLGHLQVIASAPDDVYPNTPSVGFHGATYDSKYVEFVGRELQAPDHSPLDVMSPLEESLLHSGGGSVPFIDIGGRWVIRGDAVPPPLLAGRSALQVAKAMADPSSPISQAAVREANQITAAICDVTKEQPSSVCATPAIRQIESHLGH